MQVRSAFNAPYLFAFLLFATSSAWPQTGSSLSRSPAESEKIYRTRVANDPSAANLFNLGFALHQQGRSSEAITFFLRANRIEENPTALALLALDYCRLGEYRRADPILAKAAQYASDPSVLVTLATCYLDMGRYLEAIPAFELLVEGILPPEAENATSLARAYLFASRDLGSRLKRAPGGDEYATIIREAAGQGSTNARAGFERAAARSAYLTPNLSFREAAALLPKHDQDPALLYMLTVLAGEKAIAAIAAAQEKFPSSIATRLLRADILAQQGRDELARKEYEDLVNSPGATVSVFHDAAMYFRKVKDWKSALHYFERERDLAPDDERAQVGIIESLLNLDEFTKARDLLRPIVANGNCNWALMDLARAEQELGHLDAAIRILQRAETCDGDNPALHYRLSQLLRKRGNAAAAEREIEKFKALRDRSASDH